MRRSAFLIKGGLLISFVLSGLFLLRIFSAQATLSVSAIRDTVELYTQQKHEDSAKDFFINPPMILSVEEGGLVVGSDFLIIGLAPNNSTLRIYIDDIFVDSIFVFEEGVMTSIFTYQPKWLLARETHSVYARAVSKRGLVSKPSNRFYFDAKKSIIPQISATRIENNNGDVINPIMDFGSYSAPLMNPPIKNAGFTKEFILFVSLIITLFVWVWHEND